MAGSGSHRRSQDPRWRPVARSSGDKGPRHVAYVPRLGSRFGTRVVVCHAKGRAYVRCDCGDARWITLATLAAGYPCQCCQRRGRTYSPAAEIIEDPRLRSVWVHRYSGMVSRCSDPNHRAWPNYGGRGIDVCAEWRADRNAFLRYAKTLPNWNVLGLDLDRIDNDRGYEPGNLRLVSRGESANNRRSTAWVEWKGERMPVSQFRRLACPTWHYNAMVHHFQRGRTPEWVADHYARTRGLGPA